MFEISVCENKKKTSPQQRKTQTQTIFYTQHTQGETNQSNQ